jgi:hypothetical protein
LRRIPLVNQRIRQVRRETIRPKCKKTRQSFPLVSNNENINSRWTTPYSCDESIRCVFVYGCVSPGTIHIVAAQFICSWCRGRLVSLVPPGRNLWRHACWRARTYNRRIFRVIEVQSPCRRRYTAIDEIRRACCDLWPCCT